MAKSKDQIETEADKVRKAKADRVNAKAAKEAEAKEVELADVPLNREELAFIARVRPKLNEGRASQQPSPAEITRFSRLIKRENVKPNTD